MDSALQVAANALIAGSTVALLAVSYSLIYSVLRFINFVFGEVLMLGAYAFYVSKITVGLPGWVAGGIAVALVGVAGTLVQMGAYRPFYRRSRLACLVAALGVSIILQNAALIVFQAGPLVVSGEPGETVFGAGSVAITRVQVVILGVAVGLLVLVDTLVFRTDWGLSIRALADNLPVAELLGVKVDRTIAWVFFVGSCLAGLTGVLLSFEHLLKPTMGVSPGIQAFAACVVGGIGSVRGAVVAAFLVAAIGHIVSFLAPTIPPETTAYAVLLLALAVLPAGLSALVVGSARRNARRRMRAVAAQGVVS